MEDVYDLAWSPDSNQLITGSVDNSAIVWDANKGTVNFLYFKVVKQLFSIFIVFMLFLEICS